MENVSKWKDGKHIKFSIKLNGLFCFSWVEIFLYTKNYGSRKCWVIFNQPQDKKDKSDGDTSLRQQTVVNLTKKVLANNGLTQSKILGLGL